MKTLTVLCSLVAMLIPAGAAQAYSVSLEDITGSDAAAFIEVEGDGTNQVTFRVTLAPETTADIRGVFFRFAGPPTGIQVSGADVTDWRWRDDRLTSLGGGVNMNGTGLVFDFGVAIGRPGIGKDDISSTTFVLTSDAVIDLDDTFGLRLTSVGADRQGSSKLGGTGGLPVPEPATALLLGAGLLGLAAVRKRRASSSSSS